MYELERIAIRFKIVPDEMNLRRVARALDILDADGIRYRRYNGYQHEYEVKSQLRNPKKKPGDTYIVRHRKGDLYPTCDCPDWRKPNGFPVPAHIPVNLHRCKHGIAVLLHCGEVL